MRYSSSWICIFLVAILLFTLFCGYATVSATETIDILETTPYPEEKMLQYLEDISFSTLSSEPPPSSLCCFDICKDGRIALGFLDDRISVYSADGVFLYGFSFNSPGTFSLVWNEENLCIYFVRSDLLATFNADGVCLNSSEIEYTSQNDMYIRKYIDTTNRKINNIEYSLDSDFLFSLGAARLIAKYLDGSTQIIYDASTVHTAKTILALLFVSGFFLFFAILFIRQYRKQRAS